MRPRDEKEPTCTCEFCGASFYRRPSAIKQKIYCSLDCFYQATHPLYTKERLIEIIQDFQERKGRIPFHSEFSKDRDYPNPSTYCDVFGSWNEAIQLAGFMPNSASLGKILIAEDGHKCLSFAEKLIDDWLSNHKIKHEKEVYYPNSKLRADWLISRIYVEYFGICIGYEDQLSRSYETTRHKKRTICKDNDLVLIELYPKDLQNLGNAFSDFLVL